MREDLLNRITTHYLESRDFNGLPLRSLGSPPSPEALDSIRNLISDGLINAQFGSFCLNPAIIRLSVQEPETQLARLVAGEFDHCFLYPSQTHLREVVPDEHLQNKPYRRLLALGEPQLAVRSFDLSVLEVYRNDPRYHYSCDDMHGFISISDEFDESDDVPEHDQILLETFGFAYDDEFNRGVASFVCYLARLSPEHQQIWRARELGPDYKLHPEFFRTQIQGEFPTRLPIFTAFILEMKTINKMSQAMGRPQFFRN